MSDNLRKLGNQISVALELDDDGYIGRECPEPTCLGYFKITPGTGLTTPTPCHCPYCGHTGEHSTFFTPEQIEYAKSVAMRKITDAIGKDLKAMEFEHRASGPLGIGISLKVTPSAPHPIQYYREKNLETEVICTGCSLRFAIYGVFGWCPDCGVHNSLQILSKNLELVEKEVQLSTSVEPALAEHLIGDALENVVSAFDGFGREICLRRCVEVRFQNLVGARRKILEKFHFDFADDLDDSSWARVVQIFEKRHLLAHKMGVIDANYLEKANDPCAILGRRVRVTADEVSAAATFIEILAKRLFSGLFD